jgi:hypothetical protein
MSKINSLLIAVILIISSVLITSAITSNSSEPVMKLYAQNATAYTNDPIICSFSAINPITNADTLHCQAIISVPNGMRIATVDSAANGTGQYIMNFNLRPGELSEANIYFVANSAGDYQVTGVSYYNFGSNNTDTGTTQFNTTIHVSDKPSPTQAGNTPGLTSLESVIAMIGCVTWLHMKRKN